MLHMIRWALGLAGLVLPMIVWPADLSASASSGVSPNYPVIRAIEFDGNRVTREQILRQEMLVKEGDAAEPSRIEQSRQAIMNLGLFVSVYTVLQPREDGVTLIVSVKEKYYLLPVPKLNRDENNNFSLGAELTLDNLGGYNQQLKLRYETEQSSTVADGESVSYILSYRYPRIFGTAWQLQTEMSQDTGPVDGMLNDLPTWRYKLQTRSASVAASRWLEQTGPSQGWQAGGGLVWRRRAYDYLSCYVSVPAPCPAPTAFTDASAVGLQATLSYTAVSDFLYSRQGSEYGYNGEFGSITLGSDTRYTRHEFFWRYYYLLEGRPHENIDTQVRVGLSSGELFLGDRFAYALGGNKTLRAYDTSSITGNSFVLATVQYLRPLFGYFPLRGVLFADVGNAYPSNAEMHLGKLLWDVGTGLRLRLKSFVKIDLRLDVSYSPDTGETRAFLGTKELF